MLKVIHDDWPPNVRHSAVALLEHLKQGGQKIRVTISDMVELEIDDEKTFEKLLELVDRIEAVEDIRRGLEEMKQGNARSIEKVFQEKQEKYGL